MCNLPQKYSNNIFSGNPDLLKGFHQIYHFTFWMKQMHAVADAPSFSLTQRLSNQKRDTLQAVLLKTCVALCCCCRY